MMMKLYFFLILAALCPSCASLSHSSRIVVADQSNLQAVLKNAKPGAIIHVSGGQYKSETPLYLRFKEDITIEFEETQVLCTSSTEAVFKIFNCDNITIIGGYFGHQIPNKQTCDAGVIEILSSRKVTVRSADLHGCGVYGVDCSGSRNILIVNCSIHDNKSAAYRFIGCKDIELKDNVLKDNGGRIIEAEDWNY